jgi:hypothetical protein
VSDSLFDRRMLCLRQRRAELAATVSVLQQTTAETVAQVASTATGLPPLAACEDDERLLNDRSLPTDPAVAAAVEKARERLARVQALGRSQRYQEALAELAPLQREAEALGDLTLHAEVLLRLGLLTGDTLHHAEALKPLEQAEVLALESGADRSRRRRSPRGSRTSATARAARRRPSPPARARGRWSAASAARRTSSPTCTTTWRAPATRLATPRAAARSTSRPSRP